MRRGKDVAIATEIQGVVDSVDLTASPPLLSIGGQNYTIDQIRRVVRPAAAASARRRRLARPPPSAIRCPARRLPDAGPKALAVIFKEIRIEALGLGKF